MSQLPKLISISRRARRITLQRYLLSKLVYEKEKLTTAEFVAIFENQLWLERKCATDSEFLQKFGKTLEVLSKILKEINFRADFNDLTLSRFQRKVKEQLESDFLFPRRNYPQIDLRYRGFVQAVDPNLALLERRSKRTSRRRIGIGYRDKGTLKNPAKDGSPSWQEVAMHRGPLYGATDDKKKSNDSSNSPIKYVKVKVGRNQS